MKAIRILLAIVLTFIGLNALGGGYYGMTGAKGIPIEWLHGSPFRSYFLPSLFLFVVIGGTCLLGAIAAFRNSSYTRQISFVCSSLLLAWIIVQLCIIGPVSWMQQAIIVSALIIFGLAFFLRQPNMKT